MKYSKLTERDLYVLKRALTTAIQTLYGDPNVPDEEINENDRVLNEVLHELAKRHSQVKTIAG